jgi:multidrug efflux pump subunit AcrB
LFAWLIRGYDRGLRFVFRHQRLTLVTTLALMVLTGFLYIHIPKGFFPEQDTGFIFGQAEARQDTSFAAMSKLVGDFTSAILTDPAVADVIAFAGATGGNPSENTGRFFIQLKPLAERKASAQEVIQRLRPKTAQVIGAGFFMQAGQDVNVGGRLSKTEYQYTLTDSDTDELNHWAPILQKEMEKLPELQDVASDQQIASPHIAITIDRDAAYRLGLTLAQIDQTLYDAFGQRQVATVYTSAIQGDHGSAAAVPE